MLEKGLAALAMPDNNSDGHFDFGAFLVQLEVEAVRNDMNGAELAHQLYPTKMSEWQRKFLIIFLATLLQEMVSERTKERVWFKELTEGMYK